MAKVYLLWRAHGEWEGYDEDLIAVYSDKRKAESHERKLYAELRRLRKKRQQDEAKEESGYLPLDYWDKNINAYDPQYMQGYDEPKYSIGEAEVLKSVPRPTTGEDKTDKEAK